MRYRVMKGERKMEREVEEREKGGRQGSKNVVERERYRESQVGREMGRGEGETRDKGEKTEARWLF